MPEQEENEITSVSQDDIDQLLQQEENEPEESGESNEPTEELSGESDEIEPQDDIDQLLQAGEESPEETDDTGPSVESMDDSDDTADEEDEQAEGDDTPDDPGEEEVLEGIDDIDQLLEPDDDTPDEAEVSDEAGVSDEVEASEESEPGDSESAEGDEPSPADDEIVDDPVDEIDELLADEADAVDMAADDAPDQVILEDVPKEPKKKKKGRKGFSWRPKKRFLISITVLVAIGAAFNALIALHGRRPSKPERPKVLSFPITKKLAGASDSTFEETPRSVYLKGFVVPAPLARKDITYVTADVGLEMATEEAAVMIKDQAPFFRSIIYRVISRALKSLDKSKINEVSLKLSILRDLNGEVPDRSVKDVIVDAFSIF